MNKRQNLEIREFVQRFLFKSRSNFKVSIEKVGCVLNLQEEVLRAYELGTKSPPGYELYEILRTCQADLDGFALELTRLQDAIMHRINKKE